MGGGPLFHSRTQLRHCGGPSVGLLSGMQGGPNSPRAARVMMEVLKAERRTNGASGPDPWQPVVLPPATPQMGGWEAARQSVPSKTTLVSTIHRSLRTSGEHGFHLIAPGQKVNAGCGEPYRPDEGLRLTSANGCEVAQEFPDRMVNWPGNGRGCGQLAPGAACRRAELAGMGRGGRPREGRGHRRGPLPSGLGSPAGAGIAG